MTKKANFKSNHQNSLYGAEIYGHSYIPEEWEKNYGAHFISTKSALWLTLLQIGHHLVAHSYDGIDKQAQ